MGDEAFDDAETEAGAFPNRLGGELLVEGFLQRGVGHAGAIVADADRDKFFVRLEFLRGDETSAGAVFKRCQVKRWGERLCDDFDAVRGIARLEGVDSEVEEDLKEVGAVDEGDDVGVEVLDGEFVAFAARVFDEEFLQVSEDLIDGYVAVEVRLAGAEVAQITAGNLDAADDLAVNAGDAAAHFFEFIAFNGGGVVHLTVEEFDEAVDDGEGAV